MTHSNACSAYYASLNSGIIEWCEHSEQNVADLHEWCDHHEDGKVLAFWGIDEEGLPWRVQVEHAPEPDYWYEMGGRP